MLGTVTLVGAGPGSPDLITLRGLNALKSADAILHDALVDPALLEHAKPGSTILGVGKRGYCIGSTRQETIHGALVRLAREGRNVCRLKCGDPGLFGRGGEEAEVLASEGIPVEIVPGVSSAFAAAAAGGFALTHREAGQAIVFATGHHDPDSDGCTLDWPALARMPAIAFYMATRHIQRIAAKLIEEGQSPECPFAIVERASWPDERITAGTLATLPQQLDELRELAPAVFLVGANVRMPGAVVAGMDVAESVR